MKAIVAQQRRFWASIRADAATLPFWFWYAYIALFQGFISQPI